MIRHFILFFTVAAIGFSSQAASHKWTKDGNEFTHFYTEAALTTIENPLENGKKSAKIVLIDDMAEKLFKLGYEKNGIEKSWENHGGDSVTLVKFSNFNCRLVFHDGLFLNSEKYRCISQIEYEDF